MLHSRAHLFYVLVFYNLLTHNIFDVFDEKNVLNITHFREYDDEINSQ